MADASIPHLTDKRKANFWAKVVIGEDDECWPWTGSSCARGYGRVSLSTAGDCRPYLATHVSLVMAGKPRPAGMSALHSCDNPACVNPRHLRWGSLAENMADCRARGRIESTDRRRQRLLVAAARGEDHCRARLTEASVRAIIADPRIHREIAQEYGVRRAHVGDIKRGKRWAHVHDQLSREAV
jgi:hypothetical protein